MVLCVFKMDVTSSVPTVEGHDAQIDSFQPQQAAATAAIILLLRRRRRVREAKLRRRWWVRPWLLRRPIFGHCERLMRELAEEDIPGYVAFQRVCPEQFRELLEKVGPIIEKKTTHLRPAIPPAVRLALTLRYLATGQTYKSTMFSFRVSNNTIGRIVPETCQALYDVLAEDYMKFPETQEDWLAIAKDFQDRWNFPNCVGSVDGKHINLKAPFNSGSLYFNYKGSFSIVLMAVVDVQYRFVYVDVGSYGRGSDGGVFGNCDLKQAFEDGSANLPLASPYPNDVEPMPYSLVGDEAFPLKPYMLKPYPMRNLTNPQRIYNYRLSRARRVVENAFGILANRFRVLLSSILVSPDKAEIIVLACCVLHNYLRNKCPSFTIQLLDREDPNTHELIPGAWRSDDVLKSVDVMKGNNTTKAGKARRDYLCAYFNSPAGAVPWQQDMI